MKWYKIVEKELAKKTWDVPWSLFSDLCSKRFYDFVLKKYIEGKSNVKGEK